MSVYSWRELPRVNTHRIGESPQLQRRFVLTLNTPDTNSSVMLAAIGVFHNSAHPEVSAAKCYNVEINEAYDGSRYHAEVVADYEITAIDGLDLLPWLRPSVWTFTTQGVAVPALFYYDGTTQKSLTNSAGDYFEGLTVDEAQQKIVIESNRQSFPSALAAAITNCVNDTTYLGLPADCIKVQGISGERATEQVNNQTVYYWKIRAELLARQTGWNLLLPDIGWNRLSGNVKERATVLGPDGNQIPSSNPVALNGSGQQTTIPAILTRRVYKRISMSQYFGNPPA